MRLKLLLRPGWLLLALVVVVFATACFTLLAPWQFRRHDDRKATNDAVQASFDAGPAAIDTVDRADWRRVTLTGSYLPDAEALARLRTVQGAAAFEVLTPFRMSTGDVVLVDRGFVRPVEGVRVPPFAAAPSGRVDLVARLRTDETDPQRRPAFRDDGRTQVYAVDSRTVGAAARVPIRPGYLQLEEGSPGVLGALPLPQLAAGPFLSYALQWIAFGVMTLLGLCYFTWREIKPGGALDKPVRRRSVAEILAEDDAKERADA
ncbi:SURF1 family cytochrome oxidase biogenesis protein [Actinokineospora sp.]|uniref:SURF1 family cytochrome oxidase biogenesis protein n=1 Tax=Actinokineospora sp. TaxID=1872133 RepID=UPI0040377D42